VIILQTLPSVALGLYTRWFHRGALVAGLVAGLSAGLAMLYQIPNPNTGRAHFGGSAFPLSDLGLGDVGVTVYVGFVAVLVNLLVAALLTVALRAAKVPDGPDATRRTDYFADEGDPRVHELPELPGEKAAV
jgi:SSS family solute:Na+ symporter